MYVRELAETSFTAFESRVRAAIRTFGVPSASSLLINVASSKVITLQSLSAHS